MGRQPRSPLLADAPKAGGGAADVDVKESARPERGLGITGPHAPLAHHRRLLVAGDTADQRPPGSALASATGADDGTSVGMQDSGTRSRSSRAGSQASSALPASTASVGSKPLMPALLRSVTCVAPLLNVQITHESRVPNRRSRDRDGS